MELLEALRGTAAIREFTEEPVSDAVVHRILDTARFAPSGGNKQGWRVVVVKDPEVRAKMRDLYLPGWRDYRALGEAGLRAWSPLADREAEAAALDREPAEDHRADFALNMDKVPVMLAVFADLNELAAVDRDHDRYTFAGGASVYPFVWNLLLAAREEGLGGVMTTIHIRQEEGVRELLGAPDGVALASVVFLGHPVRRPTRLRRAAVSEFATFDSFDGSPVTPPDVTDQ
ncbi:nitroreductase family protein [Actinocorallia populi]|uniref:nitroreductase family protein n=1 Tax=Actinocorallia populi TaxID=2079200 RepID=UPI000D08FB98|nr:nitroreductase family protein [Actinocorallia populi]